MTTDTNDTIRIHVNLAISSNALQTIVANAKKIAGRNDSGHYRVDTAEKVAELISRFLADNNFDAYVHNLSNYENASVL